jgi:NAD(P)-dependent dehydrogenase (short-subunit alcohol dehydrogenase family)
VELRVDGKVAVVTGASKGIGKAIGAALAGAGAQVVLTSRKQDALDAAAADIGQGTVGFAAHAGEPDQARAAVSFAVERFGGLDVLVNNAATNPYFGPILEISESQMDKTVQVNQRAIVVWTREAVAAGLGRRPGASVVNIASIGGLSVESGIGYYNVTKAAVLHLSRQLAAELAPAVRVNAIAPGLVKTDLARALWEEHEELIASRMPLGRLGEPEDIAGAALFLASDAASWMTGANLVVDGGALLGPKLG